MSHVSPSEAGTPLTFGQVRQDRTVKAVGGETLAGVLDRRALDQADAVAYEFVSSTGVESLNYAELAHRAVAVASLLRQTEATQRDADGSLGSGHRPVLILCPPGLDYVVALWGCIVANLPAVPAYPPASERSFGRLGRQVADVGAMCVLAQDWSAASIRESLRLCDCPVLSIESSGGVPVHALRGFSPAADSDVVIIQYTSGSTGSPRGVALTQSNIVNNIRAITNLFGLDQASRAFVWLPPYHDMGLIGGILTPAYVGFPVRMMSPLDFLRDPPSWVLQMSDTRATVSGGPNFGYDLVTRKFRGDGRSLDLSNWRVAFNGAEPVRQKTMNEFSRCFGKYGFRPESFLPCYGLAEATLLVTGGHMRPESCRQGRVSCGPVVPDHDIVIVDANTASAVAAGVEGEIWLRGPSVSQGYWKGAGQPVGLEAMTDLDGQRYLRTGDLGCLSNGELYVSGRVDDMLIRRGRKYFAQDLEDVATAGDPRLRKITAAFAADPECADSPIVLIAEQAGKDPGGSLAAEVRARVLGETGLALDVVIAVPPGTIPRTSSGKTQRLLCRERYLRGAYGQWLSAEEGLASMVPADSAPDSEDGELADLAALLSGIFGAVCNTECAENVSLAAIGGDSLMAAEIAAILGYSAGLPVPVDAVLTEPTPQRLARWLLRTWRGEGMDPASTINRMASIVTEQQRATEQDGSGHG